MIALCRSNCQFLQPLIHKAVSLVNSQSWSCTIRHVFREANSCADVLAGLGHSSGFQCTRVELPLPQLCPVLSDDRRGVCFPRLVA